MKRLNTNKYSMDIIKLVGKLALTGALGLLLESPAEALSWRGSSRDLATTETKLSSEFAFESSDDVVGLFKSTLASQLSFLSMVLYPALLGDELILEDESLKDMSLAVEQNNLCDRWLLQNFEICESAIIDQVSQTPDNAQKLTPAEERQFIDELSLHEEQEVSDIPEQRRGKIGYSYVQDHGIFWLDADVTPPPGAIPIAQ